MLNQFFIVVMISIMSCDQEINYNQKIEPENVPSFSGNVLQSKDGGITWVESAENLPNKNISSMATDKTKIYISYNKDSIFSKNINDNSWKQEDIDELLIDQSNKLNQLGGFHSTKNNFFADVVFGKLFRKNRSTSQWQPVNKPDDYNVIAKMKEDNQGNIYAATNYGLYVSKDNCNNWNQVFNLGWVNDFEIFNNEIFISSVQGIMSSIDGGKNWNSQQIVGEGLNLNKISPCNFKMNNGELMLIKNFNSQDFLPSNKIQKYDLQNRTWNIHIANTYLTNLKSITDVVHFQNKIYCSYADGVVCSKDNGKTWKKMLDYKSKERNAALKIAISEEGIIYCCEVSLGC